MGQHTMFEQGYSGPDAEAGVTRIGTIRQYVRLFVANPCLGFASSDPIDTLAALGCRLALCVMVLAFRCWDPQFVLGRISDGGCVSK